MRLLKCLMIICSIGNCDAPIDDLKVKALHFDKHWNLYIRELFGCPEDGDTTVETCKITPTVNYGEFLKARQEAKKVFDLYEHP